MLGVKVVTSDKRLYLRLGDKVVHQSYEQWGHGVVVEEMTSSVPGGTCLVRILFDDGRQRTFNNDMDNQMCCYYFGIRRFWDGEGNPMSAGAVAAPAAADDLTDRLDWGRTVDKLGDAAAGGAVRLAPGLLRTRRWLPARGSCERARGIGRALHSCFGKAPRKPNRA